MCIFRSATMEEMHRNGTVGFTFVGSCLSPIVPTSTPSFSKTSATISFDLSYCLQYRLTSTFSFQKRHTGFGPIQNNRSANRLFRASCQSNRHSADARQGSGKNSRHRDLFFFCFKSCKHVGPGVNPPYFPGKQVIPLEDAPLLLQTGKLLQNRKVDP